MKHLLAILFTFITFATMAQTAPLLGTTDAKLLTLESTCTWFNPTYASYQPDASTIAELNKALSKDATFLVFGGMWCSDTQNLLPKFFKTLEAAGIPQSSVKLYLVDEQKNSPDKLEKQYGVNNVPTFIIMQNGEEKGRVVENVRQSIEADLLKLLQ
ncbi:thioredoxin family protein [Adhaeribacter terreus]|uniref:Thioredoxin family protein n=1 Tax=Adhaeribacter terreus TaxID=529703 RepID=A0ABW0ECT5_9BACT